MCEDSQRSLSRLPAEIPKPTAENTFFQSCYSYLPPSISSPQVIEVPLQKSRFCWREIVPSATTHIALQSITHHFCFSPPLWKSLLLMLRAFQCHPLGSDTGGDWVLEFFLLCCLQTHLYSAPMAYLVLPLGWHNLHKFSVLYEYSPYFVLSSFFFPSFFPHFTVFIFQSSFRFKVKLSSKYPLPPYMHCLPNYRHPTPQRLYSSLLPLSNGGKWGWGRHTDSLGSSASFKFLSTYFLMHR